MSDLDQLAQAAQEAEQSVYEQGAADAEAAQSNAPAEQSTEPKLNTVVSVLAYVQGLETASLSKDEVIELLKGINTVRSNVTRTSGERRGQLAGLTLETMNEEQLKRELINANSVLYKAQQRGAAAETISKNQVRVDAVKAEIERRKPVATPAAPATTEDAPAPTEEVVTEEATV